jgi:hypothetical protein
MNGGGRKKENKETRENYLKLLEAHSFGPLHQSELNTLVMRRNMNFFMGDFPKSVSHVPTPWDSSDFTALLYVI